MRKFVAFLFVLTFVCSASLGAEFIANGDFESGRVKGGFSNGSPDGWFKWGSNGSHHSDSGYRYDNYGATIWWDDTGLVQLVPATEGDIFTLSGDMIHPSAEPLTNRNGIIKIEFWDGPGQSDNKLATTEVGVLTSGNSTNTWYHYSGSATAPTGTTEARIVLMVWDTGGGASGKAYFDNISLVQTNAVSSNPDFNGDLNVDSNDLEAMFSSWLDVSSEYDLDGDGFIDFGDFRLFAREWRTSIPNYSGYEFVWSDEFYGPDIDYNNWQHQIGDGSAYGLWRWGNNELEYYTANPTNSWIEDGSLVIQAEEESYEGFDYTSARLRSFAKQDFLYGRIEARIKLPTTQGMWPAFWMLTSDWEYGIWPASGEIDIMESKNIPTTIYGTLHFGAEGGWDGEGDTYSSGGTDFSDDFHTYRIDWEPTVIRWYVDGNLYHTVTSSRWWSGGGGGLAPFDKRFHILLNLAVGGDFPGSPNGSTVFPQQMVIDWVRVYRKLP